MDVLLNEELIEESSDWDSESKFNYASCSEHHENCQEKAAIFLDIGLILSSLTPTNTIIHPMYSGVVNRFRVFFQTWTFHLGLLIHHNPPVSSKAWNIFVGVLDWKLCIPSLYLGTLYDWEKGSGVSTRWSVLWTTLMRDCKSGKCMNRRLGWC